VLAEVLEPELDELRRGGRDEHLPAVTTSGDASGAMDVAADVALVGEERRPRVQADAHRDGAGGERLIERRSRLKRARSGREGEEERVSLGVHLDPALGGARLPNDTPVLGESGRVGLRAERVQQAGRALDVREEEGDRAGG
jgi:hypothetical protein